MNPLNSSELLEKAVRENPGIDAVNNKSQQ